MKLRTSYRVITKLSLVALLLSAIGIISITATRANRARQAASQAAVTSKTVRTSTGIKYGTGNQSEKVNEISSFNSPANAFTFAPMLMATKSVDLATAMPGGSLMYSVTITNTGNMDATNVMLSDTIDSNLTLGAVNTSPLALNDAYTSIGNVGINVPLGSGVLVNDYDPDGGAFTLTGYGSSIGTANGTAPGATLMTANGTFVLQANGSFTYMPNAGFEGTDGFFYTINDGSKTDVGMVTITVSRMVWFVDNSLGANGDGRLGSAFNSLPNFVSGAADDPGDIIFLYRQNAANYGGPLTLLNNQILIGQGATASISTIATLTVPPFSNALPATGGTRPVIANSGTNLTLGQGNIIRGFNVTNTAGAGITGNNFGNLTASEISVTASNSSGACSAAVNLVTGNPTASFTAISATSCTNGINLNATTGSFIVTGDGTLARNGSGGTITTSLDDGIALTNATNVTLQSMNLISNGDTAPASLLDAETTTGDQTVQVNGGSNIVLSGVLIQDPTGSGMVVLNLGGTNRINNNSRFTLVDNGNTHALFINNTNTNMTLFEFNNSQITNCNSTAVMVSVTNNGTSNMQFDIANNSIFEILNSQAVLLSSGNAGGATGTLTTNTRNSTFRDAKPVTGFPALSNENNIALFSTSGTHVGLVESCIFDNIAEDGTVANASVVRTQNGGGVLNATVRTNTFRNLTYGVGGGGRHMIGHVFEPPAFSAGNSSTLDFDGNIIQNTVTYTAGESREAVFIDYRTTASGGNVKIRNNTFTITDAGSGAQQGIEFRVRPTNASTVNLSVTGNTGTVNTVSRFLDIDVEASNTVNATVTGNNFTNTNGTPGVTIDMDTEAGGAPVGCLNVSGNTLNHTGGSNNGTIRLAETAGALNIATHNNANMVASANSIPNANVTTTGTPQFGQPSCTVPPLMAPIETDATGSQSGGSSNSASLLNRAGQWLRPVFSAFAAPTNLSLEALGNWFAPAAKAAEEPMPSENMATPMAELIPLKGEITNPARANAAKGVMTNSAMFVSVNKTIVLLPPGKSVTVMFTATVANSLPFGTCAVTNQASISATGIAAFNTNQVSTTILQVPTIGACPTNITTNTDAGQCTAVVNFTTPSATAGCPTPTVTCSPASGTAFAKGTTTVTCTAANGQLPNATCTFTVTVNDNQAPTLTCPTPIMTNTGAGTCSAVVNFTPTITDNCPGATAVCVPASGTTFALGTTTVNCTGMDASNNAATPCSFTVTVVDNQNPVIGACPTNIIMPATSGACSATATYTAPTATDNCGAAPVVCSPASGSTFAVGTTTVTCTATDASSNTGTCTFTVTVNDTQPPVPTCPANQTVSSNVPIAVNYPAATVTDNCPGATINCVPASGSTFAVGTTTVTCTATDASSNTAMCTFLVSVVPCTVTCPTNQTATAANGTCAATVTYPAPTTTGTCGTVTCVPASGNSFPVGVTTVTCTSAAGPSCTFTVTVTDTQLPTLTCPTNIVTNTAPNTCAATVGYTTPTASDNCPNPTVTCTPASGASFAKGVTTVTCTATDASNNMASCTFTVTVNDTQNPAITCPANIALNTGAGICTAVATYTTPTPTDNCPGATAACVPASGSTFVVGTTTVTCTATDASSNTATCTFTVTVTDNQNPTLTCPVNITTNATTGQCSAAVTYTVPTASDNCPGATVACVPNTGSTFAVGTTTVTCTATDASSNTGTCTFTVTVNDTQPPVPTCPANQTVSSNVPIAVNYPAATVTDNCPGATINCVPASGSTFVVGTTTVTCTATDASSNTATCSFTVSVIPCTITCPSNQTATAANGTCAATVTYPAPTTTGTCGTVTCTPSSGSSFAVGTTTVTCTTAAGPSCSFTVTVTDTQLPTLTCPANITLNTGAGICTAVATYTTPTASDNCPGATVTCVPASGSTFAKGVTTVTCTAKDASNNMGMCSFTVTVNDTQNPAITCPANIALNAASGQCSATATYTTPTPTDNCPGATATCLPASGSTFNVGTTTVTCTATDASSNTAACTFTVTVTDNQNPTLTCPANITTNATTGQCSAAVTYTVPTASDNCPGATVACVPNTGSTFAVGTTTVTCTATDASSNTAACTFTVTVNDNQNPTITCPANQTATSPGGPIAVTYPAPTASDNCPGVTTNCVPASGSTFNLGTTTVTCTATDAASLTATCSFTVTVITCTSITCPADIFVGTTGNSSVVTYSPPVANGNCGTITCSPASGSTFNVGTTVVSCSSSIGNQTCAFNVTVNRVGGTVSDPLVCTGPGNTVQATLVIGNNGNVNQTIADTTTFTNLVGVPNSCTVSPNVGTCTVTNGGLSYGGTLTPGQTVTITYLTQVSDLALAGAQVCTNNSVSFNGGNPFAFSVCGVVNCPVAGPGLPFPARAEASDQAAGSVLIYNIYTSSSSAPNSQNTRVSLTNVHPVLSANVHLFFVDGASCSIADSYVCLTGSQTSSFLMSDLDPGTTGYIVAVATDSLGCPINFNYLIGDEYVKFQSGHAANLGAQAFSAIPGGLVSCNQNSVTATINFDGVSYDRTPRTLALDSIGSKADGNDTMLILNRIGGNLGTGAATLGAIFGIFYDDSENSVSFSVTGGCQLRSSISNNLPRITPRFEQFIPAGRSGWMRFFSQSDIGITGSAINFNPNSTSSAGAFNQGHNLHSLTLSGAASYVIPVFPPSC